MFSDFKNNDCLMLNTARSSLYVTIDTLLTNNKDIKQILLPDLICSDIIPIIEHFGISIKFYSIDKNLNPDLNQILDSNSAFYLLMKYLVFFS